MPNLNKPNWWQHSFEHWQSISQFFESHEKSLIDLNQKSSWLKIQQGSSNDSYRVTVLNTSYFIQIINHKNSRLRPNNLNIDSSSSFYHSSLHKWLVKNLFHSNIVTINEWFLNNAFTRTAFNDQLLTNQLVDFISHLHQVNTKELTKLPKLNIKKHLDFYKSISMNNLTNQKTNIEKYHKRAIKHSTSFECTHICHNDLSSSNILWCSKGNRLKVVDWEYACISDPLMDLANLILSCQLNKQQEQNFIQCYQLKMKNEISLSKLNDMKILSHSLTALWKLAQ